MLYSRFFPDYFDADQLGEVALSLKTKDGVVRWSNLWRITDWTGGYAIGPSRDRYFPLLPQFASGKEFNAAGKPLYVAGAGDLGYTISEYRLSDPDPNAILSITDTDSLPEPTGHGDYLHDRLYPEFRSRLVDSLYVGWTPRNTDLAGAESEPMLERKSGKQSLKQGPGEGSEDETVATTSGGES